MLRHRLIFGTLMLAALLSLLWLDNAIGRIDLTGTIFQSLLLGRTHLPAGLIMVGLFLLLLAGGSRELARIAAAKQLPVDRPLITLGPMAVILAMYLLSEDMQAASALAKLATLFAVGLLATLIRHTRGQRTSGAVAAGAVTMLAMVYMGLLSGFWVLIRHDHSAWMVLALIMVTKSCDIGAYFTGRAIGRHKLIFWLSPGKTWEGFIGGVLFAGVVATVVAQLVAQGSGIPYDSFVDGAVVRSQYHAPWWYVFLCGALLGAVGQLGDLVASLFKRDAGIKDSGSVIPGFGGLLDVVDSPLVTAPLAYWMLLLAQQCFGAAA